MTSCCGTTARPCTASAATTCRSPATCAARRSQARSRRSSSRRRSRRYSAIGVIARLDRAIQYSEMSVIEPIRCGVLDAPPSRGMTARLSVPRFVREHAGIDADLAQRAPVFFVDVVAEDQIRIRVAMQPAIALDFGLELARRPAGIAEREDGVLGAGAVSDRAQDVDRRGEADAVV